MENYPTSLDDNTTLPNPDGNDNTENTDPLLDHAYQHSTVNNIVKALEAVVGIPDSADPNSHDYRIRKGSFLRDSEQIITSSLATNAADTTQEFNLKGFFPVAVEANHPCWVIFYSDPSSRTADAGRDILTTLPDDDVNILSAFVISSANQRVVAKKAVLHVNGEDPANALIYVTVVNKDPSTQTITVTLEYIPVEG